MARNRRIDRMEWIPGWILSSLNQGLLVGADDPDAPFEQRRRQFPVAPSDDLQRLLPPAENNPTRSDGPSPQGKSPRTSGPGRAFYPFMLRVSAHRLRHLRLSCRFVSEEQPTAPAICLSLASGRAWHARRIRARRTWAWRLLWVATKWRNSFRSAG